MSVEAKAVEAAMAMAKECIEEQSAIEYEWKMQVSIRSRAHHFALLDSSA